MQKLILITLISMVHFTVSQTVFGQIKMNVPNLPKIGKPTSDQGRGLSDTTPKDKGTENNSTRCGQPQHRSSFEAQFMFRQKPMINIGK
ncbi:hypothetical protein [Leptolyngbya sp. 7M]|uniref:hypothetical protein n=1 Tax=Leptolyngbya sp. 7M TaxID=2812896 RepID=UPI001B8AFA17|nr:hypothetical protein [Leptolyngbya sp. 7M]QYO65667.1 hypothetical protein JVX88_02440 [Leptolyngbya sp. 7M]